MADFEGTGKTVFSAGKVALITGGGRGIGRETGLLLSQAGAKVTILDRDEEAAKAAAAVVAGNGGEALAVIADVSKTEQVKRAFARRSIVSGGSISSSTTPRWCAAPRLWKPASRCGGR